MLERFTLATLPETEAVTRLLQIMLPADPQYGTMRELQTWCKLRDAERDVCAEKWEAKKAVFTAEWQDYPAVIEHDGSTYRKQDTYWTFDGGGMLGAPGQAAESAVRSAWEKVRPRGATVTVVGVDS